MNEFKAFNIRTQRIIKALEDYNQLTIPELYERPEIKEVSPAQWKVRDCLLSLHKNKVVRKLPPISGRSHLWELSNKPAPVSAPSVEQEMRVIYPIPEPKPEPKPEFKEAQTFVLVMKVKDMTLEAMFESVKDMAEFVNHLRS